MAATPFEIKDAIVDILFDQLNVGVAEEDRVDVFFGRKEADTTQPHVIVADVETGYEAARVAAASTLRRYDLTYTVAIEIVPGLRFRTQRDAERAAYDLLDRVLTPLVRGDDSGRSLLHDRVEGIYQVVPESDAFTVALDDNRDPQFPVLTFRLQVQLVRP